MWHQLREPADPEAVTRVVALARKAVPRCGDTVVVAIDGEPTLSQSLEECVRRLKGPAGTKVVLSVMRAGWTEKQDFALTRANITIPTTGYDVLPGGIGFLEILSFGEDTAREVHGILDKFEAQLSAAFEVPRFLLPAEHAKEITPHIHPALEQKSLLAYIFRTYIWPGKRVTFDGKPVVLPPEGPDENWLPKPEETKEDLGAMAPA